MSVVSDAVLEVRNLRVCIAGSDVDIVGGVDLDVPKGSVFGLVGESGSGKSTLARALLGHARRGLRITDGSVRLRGVDILSLSPNQLRRVRGRDIAFVPQDPGTALNPGARIGSQIRDALTAHLDSDSSVDPKARIRQVLEEVKLDPDRSLLRAYPHQLSGGQQQRVAIAMAFACRPSTIVLDEPTTGLDVTTQRHVLDTIRTLCEIYGVGAVYVTHDLAVVAELASHVAVMYSGLIIESGSTRGVFGQYLHPYTRGLISAAPTHENVGRLIGISGNVPQPGRRPAGCHFQPRCAFAIPECGDAMPNLVAIEDGDHQVRCIRATSWERTAHTAPPAEQASTVVDVHLELLRADGISAYYGSKQILKDVSITVPYHSCVAVVGESGSGKSTLARCLVGIHTNFTGILKFNGKELARGYKGRTREQSKAIQYIFQNPYSSLNPRRTVGQILSQPMIRVFPDPPAVRSAKVDASLKDVSLDPRVYRDKYPAALSGGEAQRVAIARALLLEPELLICDEITSSLDASVQATILELLKDLTANRGLSLLFISHNLALIQSIAQSVVVIHEGVVVESGNVQDVVDHPSAAYTSQLFENAPRMELADLWP
jgi:peptide/nickel transport system ATP-binding protein